MHPAPHSTATSEHHNGGKNSLSLLPLHSLTHTHRGSLVFQRGTNISSCQLHLIPFLDVLCCYMLASLLDFLPHLVLPYTCTILDIFGLFNHVEYQEQDDLSFFCMRHVKRFKSLFVTCRPSNLYLLCSPHIV